MVGNCYLYDRGREEVPGVRVWREG